MTLFSNLQNFANNPCLICKTHQMTFEQVVEAADRLFETATPLAQGLAFVQAYNTIDALIAYIGAVRRGFAVHLLDPTKQQENAALIDIYAPDIIVDVMSPTPVQVCGDGAGIHPDISILLSTSGSTGTPKFVKITHENIGSNTQAITQYLNLNTQDRGVTNLKFFYSYGMSVVNTHLAAGAALVVTDHSTDDPVFWDSVAQHRVTNIAGVPFNFEVMHRAEVDFENLPSLRLLTQAGGKLAPEIGRYFADKGVDFCVMYGQTEASPRMSYLPPELLHRAPGSIGKAIPGGTLYIVDDNRKRIEAPDVSGELVYEGPNVMAGYAETRADLSNITHIPALFTGDIAHFDADGLFYIDGRSSRFVKPYGLRISLDEIETILQQDHTTVAVTGTDARIVIAVADQINDTEIAARLGARFGVPPTLFSIISGRPIPRLSNGKTDYKSLLSHLPTPQPELSLTRFFLRDLIGNLTGQTQRPASVFDAFTTVLGNRVTDRHSTFRAAGGDSLTYMQLYLLLDEYMDSVPQNWSETPIADLEEMQGAHFV